MDEKGSSDEEDVFECGRCKEKFTDMAIFIQHKKEKSCTKVKKQKDTKDTDQDLGDVLSRIFSSEPHHVMPPITGQGVGSTTTIPSVSPTISELFTSKPIDKGIDPGSISLDLLNTLDHSTKQVEATTSTVNKRCQEWFPDRQIPENQLQEKHDIQTCQPREVGCEIELQGEVDLKEKTESTKSKRGRKQRAEKIPPSKSADPSTDNPKTKASRKTRVGYSCSVCVLNFRSRYQFDQHLEGKKHTKALKKQNTNVNEIVDTKRRPGRPPKKGACTLCGVSTDSVKDLQNHLKEMHRGSNGKENFGVKGKLRKANQQKDLCRECGSLVPKKSLRRHERRCANRKLFECPLCKHQSRERVDYIAHIESHKVWIEVDKSLVPWEGEDAPDMSEPQEEKQTFIREEEKMAEEGDDTDKEETAIFSESDLAVLGLMPKPKYSMVQECIDAIASDLKETYEKQITPIHEIQSVNEGAGGNGDDSAEPSSEKTNSKQLKCKVCKKWFFRSSLSKHMYDHHSMTKQFQCRDIDCLKPYTDIESFKQHVASHSDKLMFKCGCRQCLPNKSGVEDEYTDEIRKWKMRKYYAKLPFKCKLCWMKFPTESRLRNHHQKDPHRHACDQCGKVMVSKRQLRLHKEIHLNQRGFLCDVCGSGFKTDRDLKRHIASHGTEKPFMCSECGKAFLFKSKLTRHSKTVHATHKPFVCSHEGCRKAFARKDKLADHENTHKAPLYHCEYCSKTFFRKDIMLDHQITSHTKEYPYVCNKCNKGFLRPKALMNHQTNEHSTSVSPSTLDKLLKASASVQQRAKNPPISAAASLASLVIYDQNIASVLHGASDHDPQSLQLQSMTLTPSANSDTPSNGDLSYQMTDITGAGAANLTSYQISGGNLSDTSTNLPASIARALTEPDVLVSLTYKSSRDV